MADYASQGMSLDEHPLELLRPGLDPRTVTCAALERIPDGSEVVVAGMLVARQRPATAKGIMFLLIEDESGVTNVIVLPPVYEQHRLTVRTASLVSISGKLERREGVINVLASAVHRLERPDMPLAEVKHIEPPPVTGDRKGARGPRRGAPRGAFLREERPLMQDSLHEHLYVRGRS